MKKLIFVLVILSFIFSTISADDATKVFVDGKEIKFSVAPVMIDSRTMVQVRPLFEALGFQVGYDAKTKTITGTKGKKRITLQLDNNKADINASEYILDVAPTALKGSTMVPLRFVAEGIKAAVDVDTEANAIFIRTPDTSFYNTSNLRYDADFKVEVGKEIYWVPANKLGMPQLTKEDILKMEELTELKAKINTVYDLMLFIQTKDFSTVTGNARVNYRNLSWEIPRPADYSIKNKKSNCYGLSEMADYLLDGDYDEVGFLHTNELEGGHIINYIKHNNKYYVFDLTRYINDNLKAGVETGDSADYFTMYRLVNIHEANSLEEYVKYYNSRVNRCPAIITTFKEKFPIGTSNKTDTIYYPTNCEYRILYDNNAYNVDIKTSPAPTMEGVYK